MSSTHQDRAMDAFVGEALGIFTTA
ncbi:hypothetical protein MELB17_00480 [Marinobacter sp. ELB17]|nr:hypothetical protein MELB17_00480 [Marinobacter sp. ELB17]